MKKLILVLAIALIASPAFALTVGLQREGTSNIVDVVYSGADVANPPRAFALDISIVSATLPKISAVTDYQQGESTSTNRRYGIYPARIDVNSGGVVFGWGSPLADTVNDPGAGSALPASHIVLEFASLYFGDANAPVVTGTTSGTLAKLTLALNGQTSSFDIHTVGETTYRGGVVLEDGTQFAVDNTITINLGAAPPKAVIGLPANASTQVSVTQDLTWTAGSGGDPATARDVYFGTVTPPVTKVLADTTALTYDTGTMALNKTYYWRVDEKNATGTTTGDVWTFTTECFPNPGSAKYIQWTSVGKPSCWCALVNPRQCHGDADGTKETKSNFWAASNDLNVLVAAWNKNYAAIAGLTAGVPATPLICGDFDHATETKSNYRVASQDLNILVTNWNKANLPAADCSVSGY